MMDALLIGLLAGVSVSLVLTLVGLLALRRRVILLAQERDALKEKLRVSGQASSARLGEGASEFDLSGALKMTGGNKKLLRKVLGDFQEKYHHFLGECLDLAAEGRWEEVERKAHTLKGNSAMLGFSALSGAAAELEAAARQPSADREALIQATRSHLVPALAALQVAMEATREDGANEGTPPTENRSADPLEMLLVEAMDLLDRGEYGAHMVLSAIQAGHDTSLCQKEFTAVCRAVENGDYDAARSSLGRLIQTGKL